MRHFVEIVAPSAEALRRLQEHDLDLVRHSAGTHARGFSVEGLLDMAEVEKLRGEGYEVKVLDPVSARSRAHVETTTFEAWLDSLSAPEKE